LSHLSAAAHDDDSLSVNLLQWFNRGDGSNDRQILQIAKKRGFRTRQIQFKIYPCIYRLIFDDRHRTDIAPVSSNDSRQQVQDTGTVDRHDDQPHAAAEELFQAFTSYFVSNSGQIPRAFNSSSITSRTAPWPPCASVTAVADRFTSGRALAVAKDRPTRL